MLLCVLADETMCWKAVIVFHFATKDFGPRVSMPNTKHMVVGREAEDCERLSHEYNEVASAHSNELPTSIRGGSGRRINVEDLNST